MRARSILPAPAVLAALVAMTLAGCGAPAPAPTPTATASESPEPVPTSPLPTEEPVGVESLPASALLRLSATLSSGDDEVRVALTFDRPAVGTNSRVAFEAVQDACPNAIESQLELYPGLEPTGVITATLETTGEWPAGAAIGVAAGGLIASIGEGTDVAPPDDPPGMFGCNVAIVSGPRESTFASLLLGDPEVLDRIDLEQQIAHGVFGLESNPASTVPIAWSDCVVQLSALAQRLARDNGWALPAQWGDGCVIGDSGTV